MELVGWRCLGCERQWLARTLPFKSTCLMCGTRDQVTRLYACDGFSVYVVPG